MRTRISSTFTRSPLAVGNIWSFHGMRLTSLSRIGNIITINCIRGNSLNQNKEVFPLSLTPILYYIKNIRNIWQRGRFSYTDKLLCFANVYLYTGWEEGNIMWRICDIICKQLYYISCLKMPLYSTSPHTKSWQKYPVTFSYFLCIQKLNSNRPSQLQIDFDRIQLSK